jgi:uncharacterized cupredoxin-like copper-binding protein
MKYAFGLPLVTLLASGMFVAASAHDEKADQDSMQMDHGSMQMGHDAPAHEHAATPHAHKDAAFGRPGDPKRVQRTVAIGMNDALRFDPAEVAIKKGETVRFVVTNSGKLEHEMVLGTMSELKTHAKEMQTHAGMAHVDPNMTRVDPGKSGSLTWQFTKAGKFYYGCLVPGHLEGGMIGKIVVR